MKKGLLLLVLLTTSFGVSAQYDSLEIQVTPTVVSDSVMQMDTETINIAISNYDSSSMGHFEIHVYDEFNVLLAHYSKSNAEMSIEGTFSATTISLSFSGFILGSGYRLETNIQNPSGANYPTITTQYNMQ